MLTRSKAKALAAENTTVIVSPSATGQGIHTRWQYPAGRNPGTSLSDSSSGSSPSSSFSGTVSTNSLSHGSSSTLSDSSLSSISDGSFHTAPSIQDLPLTPPRTPNKLQRSPRWVHDGKGNSRLILIPDRFLPETVNVRESMMQERLDEVFNREWVIMMKARERAILAHEIYETDDDSDGMDTDSEMEFVRGDTEPAEDLYAISETGAPHPRVVGPHGTEIIDPDIFTPEAPILPIYPEKWANARRSLKLQPTERFIN